MKYVDRCLLRYNFLPTRVMSLTDFVSTCVPSGFNAFVSKICTAKRFPQDLVLDTSRITINFLKISQILFYSRYVGSRTEKIIKKSKYLLHRCH